MTLEESKEVIPMMEAMITQIEEQQNIMAEMLQEIREKDEKLMCFQEQQEQRIADIEQQIEKARDIDDRIRKLKERRPTGRIATADRADAGRTRPERPDYREIENAARQIADLEREVKQREQSREHSSLKERLEENKIIIAEFPLFSSFCIHLDSYDNIV